jgi:hypothetical protein
MAEVGKMYLQLFHGRRNPEQYMDDWGEQGPIFGPLQYVHTTYAHDIKIEDAEGRDGMFHVHDDMVYYDGLGNDVDSLALNQGFDHGKAHNWDVSKSRISQESMFLRDCQSAVKIHNFIATRSALGRSLTYLDIGHPRLYLVCRVVCWRCLSWPPMQSR